MCPYFWCRFFKILTVVAASLVVGRPFVNATEGPATYAVGVAQVDITPDYPVRLSGFGFRRVESEGVTQPIWAKALAISTTGDSEPVVVITVDNLGIPASMCDDVAKRLEAKVGLVRSRLAITASHTHTAPMLSGVAPTLFSGPIPDEHWQRIDRYTRELTDKLETVALAALKDRQPSRMSWGNGSVKFAINRRTKGGPVDHDLPVLVVKRIDGKIRAIYVNYACHCVTLSNNKISGDWAGYAQDLIQREFPSAVALVSIGCGADQNPSSGVTGDKSDVALQQGAEIAAEVKRLAGGYLAPISGDIVSEWKPIRLDFAEPPTRDQWEEKARRTDAAGYHARVQLERLDRGEALQATLNYPIASWMFGDSLAMVFLPGEVVVDYSRRLKRELDGGRLWVNAYANDEPCYIPSERILAEGGYEALDAMYYYDRPGALKAGLEDQIVEVVHQQLDARFAAPFDATQTSGTLPKSPQQSLAALQTTPNLRVDLVVAEPLIADPVAIDFGLDGALWVAEMHDYPEGLKPTHSDAQNEHAADEKIPGGRLRLVRDSDGDGQFDRSTIFLEHISLPTGVTVWRNGVLICSAPDILYAEDTDGDDKADVVQKLFTGFGTSNNQARLNSLTYGLDGWIYGSCGLFGGTITNFHGVKYELGDRDFRIKPDTCEIEAATGRTQQGRVRDDFGNWFGCDNSNLAFHYPLAEHYLKRNPYVGSPPSRVNLVQTDDARRLFPARNDAQRFPLSGPPGTVTAACGIGVYRDWVLGPEYQNNLFVCEPVNLLVHRMALKPKQSSFAAERPAKEHGTEFLRSTDSWFRPVQAITGPDGGLWVVDMYRFIIEDPRWIPAQELAPLDVRAGSTLGRIYRVTSAVNHTPPATRFALTNREAAPLNPKPQKLSVYQELEIHRLERVAGLAAESVPKNVIDSWRWASVNDESNLRIISFRKLAAHRQLDTHDIRNALADKDPRVRAFGITLAERSTDKILLLELIVRAASDENPRVRLQAACSLGEWDDEGIGSTLAKLALSDADDPYIVAAICSSLKKKNLRTFTTTLFEDLAGAEPPPSLMAPFLATAVGEADGAAIKLALIAVAKHDDEWPKSWQLKAMTDLVESLSLRVKGQAMDAGVQNAIERMQDEASVMAMEESLDEEVRLAAIHLLGRDPVRRADDMERLGQLLSPTHPPSVQLASVEAFERIASDDVPGILAARYREVSPAVQPRIVDAMLSRDAWYPLLFNEIARGTIPASSITAAQRQELVAHPTAAVRERAMQLLAASINADRQQVIQQYRVALSLVGNAERGKVLFVKNCSQCHKQGDIGHAVGPNLAMVANKTPSYLLQEFFDPNRNVDTRYASYVAVTKSGLIRTGILSSESSMSITLLAAEGKPFTLLRTELEELRGTGKSLMPEGMEKELSHQAVADLIVFLSLIPAPSIDGVATRILDDRLKEDQREALIAEHPEHAASLVVAMTRDMPDDAKEEYRRIPWIWRVAVACGKRDRADQLLKLLEVSLPQQDQPLRDWQAVVIGGGIINGIGLTGSWPKSRIGEILRDNLDLEKRWNRSLEIASIMADDERTSTGTRYDALRMIALDDWTLRREQLIRYLAKGVHDELQMGAISGLSDVESSEISQFLLDSFGHLNEENCSLVLEAMLRTQARSETLLGAIDEGKIPATQLNSRQRKSLCESTERSIRERAIRILGE